MSATTLEAGFIAKLSKMTDSDHEFYRKPHIVQILKVYAISKEGQPGPTRYRIIISDGEYFLQAMLATQLNYMVEEGDLRNNGVIQLEKVSCSNVQNTRYLYIILAATPLEFPDAKIGEPIAINGKQGATDSPAPSAPIAQSSHQGSSSTASAQRQNQSVNHNRTIHPIDSLSPYQNDWTIKARVAQKSDIKTWSNQRGEGQLFNVTLMDETGEIRATGFNQAVTELYPKLEEGKVYYISKGRINIAKKKFSNVQHDYEISLEKSTIIEECLDTTDLPVIKYNFTQFSQLEEVPVNSTTDVIGIVKSISPVEDIITKAQKQLHKRELTLVDKTKFAVRLTLWGKQAEQFAPDEPNPVIAFKGVKVGDFGGRSLSMITTSMMTMNPDIPEAHLLRGWFDDVGQSDSFQQHSRGGQSGTGLTFNRAQVECLSDVKQNHPGNTDKDFFHTQGTVMMIRTENTAYPACQSEGCQKKVIRSGDSWRCEKCNAEFAEPNWRYTLNLAVSDWSGQAWLQGFNDVGLALFNNMPASDLVKIKEEHGDQAYNNVLKGATNQAFNYVCRAKEETYNDNTRVRYGILRISKLNYKEEAEYFLSQLSSPWAQSH